MASVQPFLMKFAKKAGSPAKEAMDSEYYFDDEDDVLRYRDEPENPLAIELSGEAGPKTKKHDVEKGDDNKDDGIWM